MCNGVAPRVWSGRCGHGMMGWNAMLAWNAKQRGAACDCATGGQSTTRAAASWVPDCRAARPLGLTEVSEQLATLPNLHLQAQQRMLHPRAVLLLGAQPLAAQGA